MQGGDLLKLNTGIIAQSLPYAPAYLCDRADHALTLSDVRFLLADHNIYSEDILYFSEWNKLISHKGALPDVLLCVGGGVEAGAFFKKNGLTGIVTDGEDPIIVFSIIQSIFLRFNQMENSLLGALRTRKPTREILNCVAEFFQDHVILYDSERNLIDYSSYYAPDAGDQYWKEAIETGRRSEKMVAEARKHNVHLEAIRTPTSDFVELGPGLPNIMTHSFFEGGKRVATLTVAETNKPLSLYHLKLLDYVAGLLSPGLFHIYSATPGHLEALRSVLTALLDRENVDPLVVARCVGQAGWGMDHDYLLALLDFPESMRNAETLERCRHIYERIFPDCVVLKYQDSLVLLIHRDTSEMLSEYLPKLEKQLNAHDAVCGLSYPFKGITLLQAQHINAEIAIHHGDKSKRIRYLSDAITQPIIDRIAADMPLYPLCHREAVRIFEYDQANGTELLMTLETYLMHYKSLKAAAEDLYIHRNTMTYRLGCIDKIANLSLDDPKERLHLLLSCIVLRTLSQQK
jgi:hypothetical protein